MKTCILLLNALLLGVVDLPRADDLGGVVVRLEGYEGPATVSARLVGQFKVQLLVNPATETEPLVVRVDLPETGSRAWPAADVEVRDAQGKALLVRRAGIEWSKLLIQVPAVAGTYYVQAVSRLEAAEPLPSENERWLVDDVSGFHLGITTWYDGRKAALSLRFDDSHPTHLTKAIPILREYGFRGTFMVNPGQPEPGRRWRSDFQEHWAEWAAVAQQGDQELANHTAHHRGAVGDEDMENEIAEAAQTIWRLTPGKSQLLALNLGGGTYWETTRTLRYYLEKYHLFDASSGSLGMDDVYGNRVEAFREHLERHLERGLWCRVHFHAIGQSPGTSETTFRAALDIAREHRSQLWIAGMADIYKYQTERNASRLKLRRSSPDELSFELVCQTDATLFDQPLTIAVTHPSSLSADRVRVRDAQGREVPLRTGLVEGVSTLLFDVAPRDGLYSIEKKP